MTRLAPQLLLLVIACCASGCAAYQTWRKCGSGCPGDAGLAAQVRARLGEHTELLAPNEVEVRVLDGVVYLSGLVATDLQRETAETVARSTPGVFRIVDLIGLEYNGF
ncbi:MAG TPA: BON domain-containing protein [Steroidobacteraceae bacterium]|nr:BON domain-containing protein [Steroidobacteraceae bacterium]